MVCKIDLMGSQAIKAQKIGKEVIDSSQAQIKLKLVHTARLD